MPADPLRKENFDFASNRAGQLQAGDALTVVHTDERLLFNIRITAADDDSLQRNCDAVTVIALQRQIENIVKTHMPGSFIRVSLHKGSIIALVTISFLGKLVLLAAAMRRIKQDIERVIVKIFEAVRGIRVSLTWKKVDEVLGIVGDIISIAARIINILATGGLPPLPSGFDPDGWQRT